MSHDYDGFHRLLGMLGRTGQNIRLAHGDAHSFTPVLLPYDQLDKALAALSAASRNVWFEINPSSYTAPTGRSSAGDVTRLTALYADIDFKPKRLPDGRPGGMGTLPESLDLVQDLTGALGVPPAAIVYSGHGIQAYWPISDGDISDTSAADVGLTLARWKVLCQTMAAANGGGVDSVFDLPRIFRVPGPRNWKDPEHPADTSIEFPGGSEPLTLDELNDVFNDHDIVAVHSEITSAEHDAVSPMDGWEWADKDCHFVDVIGREIGQSTPASRHHWGLKEAALLHGLIRGGCVTEDTFYQLRTVFEAQFTHLCATQAPIRPVAAGEIGQMLKWGALQAEMWTKGKLAEEMRQHLHRDFVQEIAAARIPDEERTVPEQIAPTPEATAKLATVSSIFGGGKMMAAAGALPVATTGNLALDVATQKRLVNARFTDTGNAEVLGQSFRPSFRFTPSLGWLMWTGNRYEIDHVGGSQEAAKDLLVERMHTTGDDAERKWLHSSLSRGRISAMLDLARTIPHLVVPATTLDSAALDMVTPGGIVNLVSSELRDASPFTDFNTMQAAVTPKAGPTPMFDEFMEWAFSGDQEMISYLQRLFGIAAIGAVRWHLFPIFLGVGANGKSTLLNIIAGVFGQYASMMPQKFLIQTGQEPHPEAIARLRGIRLAISAEAPPNAKFDEELVKMISGETHLTGRLLYENSTTFTNTTTLFMAANHLPTVAVGGPSFWRRMRRVDFKNQMPVEKQNPLLTEQILRAEAPGVLAWVLEGARQALAHGEQPPLAVLDASRQYQLEEDAIARFLEDRVVETPGIASVSREGLYEVYKQWNYKQGLVPLTFVKFSREMVLMKPESDQGKKDLFTNIALAATEIAYANEDAR